MPRISIILPVYNVERYLPQCLESILSQSYADFELLAIDDASEDRSVEIVRAYAEKDSRIRLLEKTHSGLGNTRNHGIEQSTGEYLLFADSDDFLAPDALKTLIDTVEQQDSELIFFNFYRDNSADGTSLPAPLPYVDPTEAPALTDALYQAMIGFNPANPFYGMPMLGSAWRRFVKRSLFVENDIRYADERMLMLEDLPTSIRLHNAAKRITLLSAPLYHYRYNPASLTTRYREGKFEMLKRCFENVKAYLVEHGSYANYEQIHGAWFLRFAVHESLVNLFSPAHAVSPKTRYSEICAILTDKTVKTLSKTVSFKTFPKKDRLIGFMIQKMPTTLTYLFYRLYASRSYK